MIIEINRLVDFNQPKLTLREHGCAKEDDFCSITFERVSISNCLGMVKY